MRSAVVLSSLLLLSACTDAAPFERSCGGEPVDLCGPHEYALVRSASLEPEELPVADFSRSATIRVELDRCDDAPAPHAVRLEALIPDESPPPDAGPDPVLLVDLLTLEEGRDGDTAGDDVIEVEVPNPFIATLPPESDITLRFTARSTAIAGCSSGVLEIPYRTGPRRM